MKYHLAHSVASSDQYQTLSLFLCFFIISFDVIHLSLCTTYGIDFDTGIDIYICTWSSSIPILITFTYIFLHSSLNLLSRSVINSSYNASFLYFVTHTRWYLQSYVTWLAFLYFIPLYLTFKTLDLTLVL